MNSGRQAFNDGFDKGYAQALDEIRAFEQELERANKRLDVSVGQTHKLEQQMEELRPLAEAHAKELELQYDRTDDGAHYQMWQDALKALASQEEEAHENN